MIFFHLVWDVSVIGTAIETKCVCVEEDKHKCYYSNTEIIIVENRKMNKSVLVL